jgi:hypothetical protein
MTIYLKAYDKWGRCCYNCNGVDECDCDEKVYIGDYCPRMESAPSSLTEYKLYTASETCFGTYDWSADVYREEIYQEMGITGTLYFRTKIETEWVQDHSAPAYTMELWWNATQAKYEHIIKEDSNGNPLVCGTGMVGYKRADGSSGTAMLYALSPVQFGNNLSVTSLTNNGTRWQGGEGMFSWRHGHPSAGGWLQGNGTAHFLSPWNVPYQVECPEYEE